MDILSSEHGDVVFPNWSIKLFTEDLIKYPMFSKDELIKHVKKAYDDNISYRDFFLRTRDFQRPCHETIDHERLWMLMNNPNMIFYFEDYLISAIDRELTEDDFLIIEYLQVMDKYDVNQWDAIVQNIGACCFEFFAKEPQKYTQLLKCTDRKNYENMTDQQLLDKLDTKLSIFGPVSRQNSRSELLDKVMQQNKLIDI